MIAYHFPPIRHSSGIQRTLKFATYLRDSGWQPIVLSAHPRAYPEIGTDQLNDIPDDVLVFRAFALDTVRHLALKGKYPFFLGNPDRWRSWVPFAISLGKKIIKQHNPSAIWSTYPIPSAHVIAHALCSRTGLPWVADFRDQMIEPGFPPNPKRYAKYEQIEKSVVRKCSAAVFTTDGTKAAYAKRYPNLPESLWHVIPNGYDEGNFLRATELVKQRPRVAPDGQIVMVHAGILYPRERDPSAFFEALSRLKARGVVDSKRLKVILRATGHDEIYRPVLDRMRIEDIVELAPGIAYEEALAEMLMSDVLLLFQAAGCNNQIPAKVYEYMRAQKMVLAITDNEGSTADVIRKAGAGLIVSLKDAAAIEHGLEQVMDRIDQDDPVVASLEYAKQYSRQYGARQLSNILDGVVSDT